MMAVSVCLRRFALNGATCGRRPFCSRVLDQRLPLPAWTLLGASAVGAASLMSSRQKQRWLSSEESLPDVLVVGGTGLMGVPTVRQLQARGHRVVVMSRGSGQGQGTRGRRPELPPCETICCDRNDTEGFHAVLTGAECPRVVVDFMAMRPEHIDAVLAAHAERHLQHYIFVSTNMVYPGGPENMDVTGLPLPISEDAVELSKAGVAPDSYGGRKLKCEALLQRAAEETGFPVTVLRPPAVVGPGCDNRHERLQRLVERLPPLPAKPTRRPAPKNPGKFCVAYSGDVAAAAVAVVGHGTSVHGEAFNIASTRPITLREYVEAIARHVRQEPPPIPDDPALRNYENQGVIDVSKAERVLGFRATPFDHWMQETVAWHSPLLSPSAAL
eukprot:TRINITY_DN69721_c0_g1_i1.p1 TRINITY_DN69721_c0_g1~~TRINITY_DN69721_c0_g1_i1.p1  ORF type:complete len:386 (-),score=46.46 TRINITY_DN69721_c0_g1_i1:110-1267(-)